MISWALVRGNKHLFRTKNAQEDSSNATSSQIDSSSSSHKDKANTPYHNVADTAELQGPAQDFFSDIIDVEMTEVFASTTEQVAARGHPAPLVTYDDEEGHKTYRHVGVWTSSRPVYQVEHLPGCSHEAVVSMPSIVSPSCEYDSGFGPTLSPIHEVFEDLSVGSRQPRPIEPPVDCGPSPHMLWEGSQRSFGTSSYGEHSSGLFRHTTGMASGPPTPSDASFRTSTHTRSLSNGANQDTRFCIPKVPKDFFGFGRVFAVAARRPHGGTSSAQHLASSTAEVPLSLPVENSVSIFIVIQPEDAHTWCVSVNSYGGQGLTAPGLRRGAKESHAIIHDEDTEPCKLPNEPRMRKRPIRLSVQDSQDLISSASRINFGSVRRIGFDTRLRNVGQVSSASLPYFRTYALDTLRTRNKLVS